MTERRPPVDQLADVFVYAPLGLALEARRLLPDLADRGRRQVKFTRVVGKYAVRRGEERVVQVWGDATGTVEGILELVGLRSRPSANGSTSAAVATDMAPSTNGHHEPAPVPDTGPRADSSGLAIPDYDSLSAFQVVPRLEGLGGGELEAVREYEQATRGRRTILNRIAQLQAG